MKNPSSAQRPKSTLPPPRRIKRRATDLLREARRLHKKRQQKVDPAAAAEVAERIEAVAAHLPSRRNRIDLDPEALYREAVALDHKLSAHYGQWRKGPLRELVEALAMAVLLAVIIRMFFIEAFSIPSSSMYPTLEIGDHLFISKIRYGIYAPFSTKRMVPWAQPRHGDVIVFEYQAPGERHHGDDFIKRVVAVPGAPHPPPAPNYTTRGAPVPGDRIRLADDKLILNGEQVQTEVVFEGACPIFDAVDYRDTPVHQCPCVIQRETVNGVSWLSQHITEPGCSPGTVEPSEHWPLEHRPVARYFGSKDQNPHFPDVLVPEGHVLVMGDNRDNSQDGRFWGFVPYDRIKGKAFVIWWARDFGRILNGM